MSDRDLSEVVLRDLRRLVVPEVGEVSEGGPHDVLPWVLRLPGEVESELCEDYLRTVFSSGRPSTVRSYAYDLLRWFRFLAAIEVEWNRATPTEVRDFVLWMRETAKKGGAKRATNRDQRVARNSKTGKAYLDEGFQDATINHNETVIHGFYKHHVNEDRILANPVLRGDSGEARSGAHQNPLYERRRRSRGGSRQKTKKRLPRAMPDTAYDEFFEVLTSNRDRALIAVYVSSGARPGEVVGMNGEDLNLSNGLITIRRKGGGAVQEVAISDEAVTWFRRYQHEVGVAAPGEPLWATSRGPTRRLTYDAVRAIFRRANEALGTNWSPHDLRHTAATRMVNTGTNVRTVQEVLGHASLDTMIVYTTPTLQDQVDAVRRAADRTERVFDGPRLDYDADAMNILFGDEQ